MKNTVVGGYFKLACVDAEGNVVKELPLKRNLITDSGMAEVAARDWENCMSYGVAGDGSTGDADYPIAVDSGSTSAFQNSTTVTANASIFTADHAGWLIVWDNGAQALIQTYTNATEVEVDKNQTVGSGPFTLYRVNADELVNETDRLTTLVTGAAYCGYTQVGGVLTLYRTWDAGPVVGSPRDYTEVGVSWSNTGPGNLFSRLNLVDAPFTVLVGQRLRLTYQLVLTLTPAYNPATAAPTKSISIAGVGLRTLRENRQLLGLKLINSSGAAISSTTTGGTCMEPSADGTTCEAYIGTSAASLANFGSNVNRSSGAVGAAVTFNAVTSEGGVFKVSRDVEWDNATAIGSSWRCVGISDPAAAEGTYNGYTFVLTANLAKTGVQSLSFVIDWSWVRSFS